MADLAIVIPAYKLKFFSQALESLANQTNKDFKVYIGDDNSPENLKSIVSHFHNRLDISYTRFENNIGAKELVKQWQRCVDLIGEEKWIWLFSDDDTADNSCVETFYNVIRKNPTEFDAYRFNTRIIDDKGNLRNETPESPLIEKSEDLAYHILTHARGNSMPDHIFSRRRYNEVRGFVYTDFAQAADWATSILFSKKTGLYTMPGPKVNWRLGASNISGKASLNAHQMIKGYIQFLTWLSNFFEYLQIEDRSRYEQIVGAMDTNLNWIIKHHYKTISLYNYKQLLSFYYKQTNSLVHSFIKVTKLYKQYLFTRNS